MVIKLRIGSNQDIFGEEISCNDANFPRNFIREDLSRDVQTFNLTFNYLHFPGTFPTFSVFCLLCTAMARVAFTTSSNDLHLKVKTKLENLNQFKISKIITELETAIKFRFALTVLISDAMDKR
jgi:hypothetical protein